MLSFLLVVEGQGAHPQASWARNQVWVCKADAGCSIVFHRACVPLFRCSACSVDGATVVADTRYGVSHVQLQGRTSKSNAKQKQRECRARGARMEIVLL